MRRRELIALIGGVAAWPLAGRAQNAGRRPLIGYLATGRKEALVPLTSGFLEGMRDLRYVQGQTFDFIERYAYENLAQVPALAVELVQLNPDVIVVVDPPGTLAAKKATPSIPIVSGILIDPIAMGLVASYRQPGGNVTGILNLVEGLSGKQVEIALMLAPGATAIGLLVNPTNPSNVSQLRDVEAASLTKGIKIVAAEVRTKADLDSAFKLLTVAGVGAVIVLRDFVLFSERLHVAELAVASRLPSIFSQPEHIQAGGLISYGVSTAASFRRVAYFVDRILKGQKPEELPVEFPTKLTVVINMKTAKALRLDIPSSLLLQADEVIE
jgi:putative ABC transport system substrate-binding protein